MPLFVPIIIAINALTYGPAVGVALTDGKAAPDELKLKTVDALIKENIQDKNRDKERYGTSDVLMGMNIESSEIKARNDYFGMASGHIISGYKRISNNIEGNYSDENRYVATLSKDVDGNKKEYQLVCNVITEYKKQTVDSTTLELNADSVTRVKIDGCEIKNNESQLKGRVSLEYGLSSEYINDTERAHIEKEIASSRSNSRNSASVTRE